MRFIVVLNSTAGPAGRPGSVDVPGQLRDAFRRAGVEADIRVPAPDQLMEAVRAAAAERPDAVIVGGGDGTVRGAAEALAGTGVVMGVLPLGTLNHFAKDLQMPAKLEDAVAALVAAKPRAVDVGEVNGHVFINNCSLGAYAEAVRRRDRLRKSHGFGKGWAMIRAAFAEFRRLRRLRLRITVHRTDDDPAPPGRRAEISSERLVRTPVVVVGNNRYAGQLLRQNLRPHLDQGQLWLYTVRARRHLALLRMMLQSLVRRLDDTEHLDAEPAAGITIASESDPVPVAADGELLSLSEPFHFRIRAGALRVLTPPVPAPEAGT